MTKPAPNPTDQQWQLHPLVEELVDLTADFIPAAIEEDFVAVIARLNKEVLRPDLWGASQVADYLGVRRQNLLKMKGLPEPAVPAPTKPRGGGRGRLWRADQIRAFGEQRKEQANGR